MRTSLLSAIAAAALFTSSSAYAQGAGWLGGSPPAYAETQRVSYYESRRVAYDNGYRAGLKPGERDGRRNSRYWFENERAYQRADKGYHRSYGDIERYRQSFRTGFAAGYQDGYERYARTVYRGGPHPGVHTSRGPGGYPPAQARHAYGVAFENGLRDGYDRGLDDARRNRRFDPIGQRWYREGDRGYDRRHAASRDEYKDLYRRGFREGYEAGYRDGGRR